MKRWMICATVGLPAQRSSSRDVRGGDEKCLRLGETRPSLVAVRQEILLDSTDLV